MGAARFRSLPAAQLVRPDWIRSMPRLERPESRFALLAGPARRKLAHAWCIELSNSEGTTARPITKKSDHIDDLSSRLD